MPTPINPCLWFDSEAEDAANHYIGIFPNSRITDISHYGNEGQEIHGQSPGKVMTVAFELDGKLFTGLNGGPAFTISPAISFQIMCDTQEEVDHYWEKLKEGGPVEAQQCGWVQDKFGVSWQIIPKILLELLRDPDRQKSESTMRAMLRMKKLDIAALKEAHGG